MKSTNIRNNTTAGYLLVKNTRSICPVQDSREATPGREGGEAVWSRPFKVNPVQTLNATRARGLPQQALEKQNPLRRIVG